MPDFHEMVRERLRDAGLSPLREVDIVEEMAQDLRDRYDSFISSGMTETEAAAAVAAELRDVDLAQEIMEVEHRWAEPAVLGSASQGHFGQGTWHDLRYALRLLRLNPGFTAICVLSLALGIGANTAIFQLLDAVRMQSLPVNHPEELGIVRIQDRSKASGSFTGRYSNLTTGIWKQIRQRQQGFTDVAAWGTTNLNLNTGGVAEYARGIWVSGQFFDVLQTQPFMGRLISPADDVKGCAAPGAVISYSFWERYFGGDPRVVGRQLTLEGHPFEVIGVTPPNFYGIDVGLSYDVAIPLCSEPMMQGESSLYDVSWGWWLGALGRLKPGWTLDRATAQLEAVSPGIMQDTVPTVYDAGGVKDYLGYRLGAYPGANGFSRLRTEYESPLWILLALAGLVLLIACVNLANLMLARASQREREIAVRLALGASRPRLIRQLLMESVVLAIAGGATGIALAGFLSPFLMHFLDTEGKPVYLPLTHDWRVLGFTTLVAAITCLIFGLAPAVRATKASPSSILNSAGRSMTLSRERLGFRSLLVIVQVSLSLVLVVGALLFVQSLRNLVTLDPGFQRHGMLIVDADFTRLKIPMERRVAFREQLLERIRSQQGVTSASETNVVPLSGWGWNNRVIVGGVVSQGHMDMMRVSSGYFRTMGTPILRGRDFNSHDTAQSQKVAIVNEEFVREVLPGMDPIGKTFQINSYGGVPRFEIEIVGVVANSKYRDLREKFEATAFYPQAQDAEPDPSTSILVRSELDSAVLTNEVKNAIAAVNPGVDIRFESYDGMINDQLLRERLLAALSGLFAALAVVLAIIGLYGLMAYTVARRSNEIGIRVALGAVPAQIVKMVLSQGLRLITTGLIAGTAVAVLTTRWVSSLLYGLKPYDPACLIIAAAGLALVATVASIVPARRAAKLDPMDALREQ